MLRLIKTSDGEGGAPKSCKACGKSSFINAGFSWHCADCGVYIPTDFRSPRFDLKRQLDRITVLQGQFKNAIDDLERIVSE